jgi:hypothetical protein
VENKIKNIFQQRKRVLIFSDKIKKIFLHFFFILKEIKKKKERDRKILFLKKRNNSLE